MWKYVLKRIGLAFVTTFLILSLTFILMKLLPFEQPSGTVDQVYAYYQAEYAQGFVTRCLKETPSLGKLLWNWETPDGDIYFYYKTPVMTQYFNWLRNIVTEWNWGLSRTMETGVSAITIIGRRLPVSISINILSVIISVPLGIILGIIAALKKNTTTDHIISTGIMIFISIPSFILITILMSIFCYGLHWLPTKWPTETMSSTDKFLGYILPVVCLSFGSICGYARFTRAELCEVMSSDYLLLARTKGLTKRQAILRHALRNAMVPIVPSILAEFIMILGGSMILENLYGIPGIGKIFVDALTKKDYSVLMVDMAVFTSISLFAGVILDISYGFIDPRIRMGAKK